MTFLRILRPTREGNWRVCRLSRCLALTKVECKARDMKDRQIKNWLNLRLASLVGAGKDEVPPL